jgi:hypothetical protein
MTGPLEPDVNIEEIMKKIKEEVAHRKRLSGFQTGKEAEAEPLQEAIKASPPAPQGFLWKFGTKYASLIKRIPIVRQIAEKWYWRMAEGRGAPYAGPRLSDGASSFLDTHTNYEGFLEQVRQEGIKGRIKLLIFSIIGFFAWWQGQINRALHEELISIRERMEERDRLIQALLQMQQEQMNGKIERLRHDIEGFQGRIANRNSRAIDQHNSSYPLHRESRRSPSSKQTSADIPES